MAINVQQLGFSKEQICSIKLKLIVFKFLKLFFNKLKRFVNLGFLNEQSCPRMKDWILGL